MAVPLRVSTLDVEDLVSRRRDARIERRGISGVVGFADGAFRL